MAASNAMEQMMKQMQAIMQAAQGVNANAADADKRIGELQATVATLTAEKQKLQEQIEKLMEVNGAAADALATMCRKAAFNVVAPAAHMADEKKAHDIPADAKCIFTEQLVHKLYDANILSVVSFVKSDGTKVYVSTESMAQYITMLRTAGRTLEQDLQEKCGPAGAHYLPRIRAQMNAFKTCPAIPAIQNTSYLRKSIIAKVLDIPYNEMVDIINKMCRDDAQLLAHLVTIKDLLDFPGLVYRAQFNTLRASTAATVVGSFGFMVSSSHVDGRSVSAITIWLKTSMEITRARMMEYGPFAFEYGNGGRMQVLDTAMRFLDVAEMPNPKLELAMAEALNRAEELGRTETHAKHSTVFELVLSILGRDGFVSANAV
jgi:hypothetical protein